MAYDYRMIGGMVRGVDKSPPWVFSQDVVRLLLLLIYGITAAWVLVLSQHKELRGRS